jgi:hypothetical protein
VVAFFSSGGSASTPWCGGYGSPSSVGGVELRVELPPSLDLAVAAADGKVPKALGFRVDGGWGFL